MSVGNNVIEEFGIKANSSIRLIEPVDFLDFLQLESNARLVLTDSGGVQEETCILGVPSVTLRDNTERPETVEVGSNVLAGTEPRTIVKCARSMLERDNGWKNPFGDGKSAERIGRVMGARGYRNNINNQTHMEKYNYKLKVGKKNEN